MTSSCTLNSVIQELYSFNLALHQLLTQFDPSRFKNLKEDDLKETLTLLQKHLNTLLENLHRGQEIESIESLYVSLSTHLDSMNQALRGWSNLPSFQHLKVSIHQEKEHLSQEYHLLCSLLRSYHSIHFPHSLPALRPTNPKRSGFHFFWALLAVILAETCLTPIQLIGVSSTFMTLAWLIEWGKRSSRWGDQLFKIAFGAISHSHERSEINSATWYATAVCISTLLFDPLYVILGVLSLGIGDPIAGLVGRRWGKIKLIHRRTLEGSLAFWLSAFLVCLGDLFLFHPLHPHPFTLAAMASLGGMIGELLSSRFLDDNFTVPLGSASFALLWSIL